MCVKLQIKCLQVLSLRGMSFCCIEDSLACIEWSFFWIIGILLWSEPALRANVLVQLGFFFERTSYILFYVSTETILRCMTPALLNCHGMPMNHRRLLMTIEFTKFINDVMTNIRSIAEKYYWYVVISISISKLQ